MLELADEVDSKSISGNGVRVQVPPPAFINKWLKTKNLFKNQGFKPFLFWYFYITPAAMLHPKNVPTS